MVEHYICNYINYKWNKNDLQLLTHDKFCELIQAFGVDHVLFGTDSPWADPEQELKKINRQLDESGSKTAKLRCFGGGYDLCAVVVDEL